MVLWVTSWLQRTLPQCATSNHKAAMPWVASDHNAPMPQKTASHHGLCKGQSAKFNCKRTMQVAEQLQKISWLLQQQVPQQYHLHSYLEFNSNLTSNLSIAVSSTPRYVLFGWKKERKNHSALVIVMELKTVSINNLVEAFITLEFGLWLVFGSDHNADKLATFLQFTEVIHWIGLIDKFILTKKRSDSE